MKFELGQKADAVRIHTVIDDDGDVAITANGVVICWIQTDGRILLCKFNGIELSDMGFTVVTGREGTRVEVR